ncbi:MAG: acetylesterase [Lachnospiraceae bacterium]|nr:acetylesterase [Lachnospiraceae bacterium]MCI9150897.1 acetylesterase [Lachnospiraceae bacterium]
MAVFQVNFMAETLGRTVPLYVILPTDKKYFPGMPKREEGKPYKTLYLLHGTLGSYVDWLYGTRIQRWAEERDLAVVMPSGENSRYLDQAVDRYGEFVGRELVEFTRKTFPLSREREDTYIGGLSMGGFGAMRNGLKYHETFGAIISLSGAFVMDESILVEVEHPRFPAETQAYRHLVYGEDLKQALESDRNPKYLVEQMVKENSCFPDIYMACGREDSLFEKNRNFSELLTSHQIPHVFEAGAGSHEWDFWDTYIKKALDWLPLEEAQAGKSSGNVGLK